MNILGISDLVNTCFGVLFTELELTGVVDSELIGFSSQLELIRICMMCNTLDVTDFSKC